MFFSKKKNNEKAALEDRADEREGRLDSDVADYIRECNRHAIMCLAICLELEKRAHEVEFHGRDGEGATATELRKQASDAFDGFKEVFETIDVPPRLLIKRND